MKSLEAKISSIFFRLRCQTPNRLEVVKAEFKFRGGITFEVTFCHCLKMIVAFRELKILLFEESELSLESLKVIPEHSK